LHLESLCLDGVERLIDAPSGELVGQTSIVPGIATNVWGRKMELNWGEPSSLNGKEFAAAG
jgi:hypothetical protein